VGTKGIPPNLSDLRTVIEEIRPAHLDFDFAYTYNTWDMVEAWGMTWDELEALNITWDQLLTYGEV
jgi:hypothetical protein